ncbi:hypothetical protein PTTG_03976 [Puccinia triticina 1-1 BBBD Race 1]|uniref:Uncharacterized protein n=2 Tax=Puccinia triticina TaxID=208348 RepID=A0A180G9J0_PUCT1|nr:uncharacterized protein PtA15_5A552 [Puccinia triticina]OAV89376.1 hypothetical protein PTTG_03976 [Puccinia triticina 1-1 BBBD Race 1]WAQ84979.1 hypothetical protein PtA15_5A552 [Puccinia triticina]WAR58313.1 hypothetical protein PtB15_5B547 [Puccinia triticina]
MSSRAKKAADPSKHPEPAKHSIAHSSSPPARPSKTTTAVRHRLPKRKVNNVWKPLSSKSCEILQDSLSRAMKEPRLEYPSLRRIETMSKKLTNNIRVPLGVYTGLKANDAGQVDLISLDALIQKNQELELLIQQRQRAIAKLEQKLNR